MRFGGWLAFLLLVAGVVVFTFLVHEETLTPRQQRIKHVFECIDTLPEPARRQLVEEIRFTLEGESTTSVLRAYANQVGDPAIETLERALFERSLFAESACR